MTRKQIAIILAPRTSILASSDSPDHDIAALALGLKLAKESRVASLALSVAGPLQTAPVCHEALTAGCSRAVCIRSQRPLAFASTARLLARFLREEPPDMIVCGDHYSDHGNAAVAGALARLLDWPLVTGVLAAKASSKGIWVHARSDRGHEELQCQGPIVLAALQRTTLTELAAATTEPKSNVEEISADSLVDDTRVDDQGVSRSDFSPNAACVELMSEPAELLSRLLTEKLWRL